jgi:hypothetical protein
MALRNAGRGPAGGRAQSVNSRASSHPAGRVATGTLEAGEW